MRKLIFILLFLFCLISISSAHMTVLQLGGGVPVCTELYAPSLTPDLVKKEF
jgi:hypothetical protein